MTDAPTTTMPRKVRVGLLVDSLTAPAWMHVMIERIVRSSYAEIVVVVRDASPSKPRPPAWRRALNYRNHLLYLAYRKLDRKIFQPQPDAFAPRDLGPLLQSVPVVEVVPERKKFSDRFSDSDLARLEACDVDVLVRLGFRILRGEILNLPRCGVWSFHHGDPDFFRGGPACAWEVFLGHPTTGSVLQILNEELDGGLVLYRSQSCTDTVSLARGLNYHYWKTLAFLPRKLEELHRLGPDCFMTKARKNHPAVNLYSQRMYTAPRNGEMARILVRLAAHMARRRFHGIVTLDQWRLYARRSESLNGSLDRFQQIEPPHGLFWADPNIFEHEGRCHVFCEEYPERTKKGTIVMFTIGEDGQWPAVPTPILECDYHLSYPFLFRHQNEIYMLVECATVHRVELYRAIDFPRRWSKPTILMDNVDAVDVTLHEQDGRWWLFANMIEHAGAIAWDELYLFHSTDPTGRDWTPHPQNPIVSDVRSARPAGRLFWHDGKLIRPSQNSAGGYGRAIVFNHVTKLTETEYEECPINQVYPDWHPAIRATHTFARGGGWTVVDADRWRSRFSWK
jgi:hypothetical protein